MNEPLPTGHVEESYPLSPLQQGMLFHSLYGKEPGVDVEQILTELHEDLNVAAFHQAWQRIVERHAILRSSFQWEGIDEPLQEVNHQVRIHWEFKDWRGLSHSEQNNRLDAYLQAERRRGFNLAIAPLMRLALMRMGVSKFILAWTFHHLLIDGRTLVVLFNELFAYYDAFCAGYELELPAPPRYRDYIEWLQKLDFTQSEIFWRHKLGGFTTPSVLPMGAPANGSMDSAPSATDQQLELSQTLTSRLRAVAGQHDVTLNTLIQGAWAILLSRYTGQNDVAFGAIRACRHSFVPGVDSMVGLLINTVPVRVRVDARAGLFEWLRELRKHWIDLRAHENTPLSRIQEWSEIRGGQPIFETLVNVQDPTWDMALCSQGGPWRKRRFALRSQPNFPLAVDVYGGPQLILRMWYSQRRFSNEVIAHMLGHFQRVLEGMTEPCERVGDLPWMKEEERRQVLTDWNQTDQAFATSNRNALELFEGQVARAPNALAIASGDEQLNYAQLNARAQRIGAVLHGLGVKPDELVAVCLERSPSFVAGLLGVWKAGGAYVPLDASYPDDRLRYMVEDAKVKAVLTERKLAARFSGNCGSVLCIEDCLHEPTEATKNLTFDFKNSLRPENLAYVIYTSGSTGKPKGVEVQHDSLMNLIAWHHQTYQVREVDRATQVAGPGFDACVWELWPYLTAGASVWIADEKTKLSPREMVQWLADQRISLCFLPTPLAHAVMDESWPKNMALRAVLTGGEKLNRRTEKNFPCDLINHYGPTENTVVATCAVIGCASEISSPIPIGRPISNTQAYILDRNMDPVPVSVPGELFVGGKSLARGYWNQRELTAERFVPNPFSREAGARLYKTGDLVRFLPDGNIEFLGRIDQQVKIRGYRVELGEIETVLSQHPDVREAVVTLHQNGSHKNRLAAYVAPKRQRQPTAQQFRDFLKAQLPDYMVPTAFVLLDNLPLTANGKVNRDALPALNGDADHGHQWTLPRTPTEEALAAVWEEVLSLKQVGVHDNFFELGGHSMLATQVISRIYRVFQCDLPVSDLFEFPTIAALAERIDRSGNEIVEPQPPLVARDHGEHRPLSFAQERLWFLEQLEPDHAFNNVPVGVKLDGPMDENALKQCVVEIARRHETLRSAFEMAQGQTVATVRPEPVVLHSGIDLSQLTDSARHEELRRLIDQEARQPIPLTECPLWRTKLIRLAKEEHYLIVNMHHTISDGWSVGVLFREIKTLYENFVSGREAALPKLPIQYSDFAAWQREWLQGEALEKQLSYWKQQLGGLPPTLNLPADRPRPAVQSYRGAKVFFALPTTLSKALHTLGKREGVTTFMLSLATFQTLLCRYSGQEDISVGSPISGRKRIETEGLIGFFTNTLVLRTNLAGDPTFRELLVRVRDIALKAYAHQDLPFEKLVDGLQLNRSLSHSPLFQVMFIFQRSALRPFETGGLKWTPEILDSGTSKFDLTLSLEESGEDISGFVEFDTALFEQSTITRLLGHYQTLLEAITIHPDERISQLPLLSPDERKQVVNQWNATQSRYPKEQFVHRLFEQQAEKNPGAIAVTCGTRKMNYATLNANANRLANYLKSLGVGPEALVGLFAEPSLEAVTGLLGILKAGGAYVPLDPTYPEERLAFMLKDSKPGVILTQQKFLAALPAFSGRVICLDADGSDSTQRLTDQGARANRPPSPLCPKAIVPTLRPENIAYVLYTSGSTGRPKGVCVTHNALTNFLYSMRDQLEIRAQDTLLSVTTLSFDIAGLEVYLPLTVGAQVNLPGREIATDGPRLARAISESGATLLQATPSTWRMLIESGWAGNRAMKILCGGENLPRTLADALLERCSELWNLYGPTETTIWSAAQKVQPGAHAVPIGRPIANTQFYILDQHQRLAPIGVPGEFYIGGEGIARGYLNRPDLTAARFVPNPFGNPRCSRLYRTGDLARWLPDGTVEFLGRIDQQIKLRGYRIELGEIESTLARHPAIRGAVVVIRREDSDREQLVAYVTRKASAAFTSDELRDFLAKKLPAYMIPSAFVSLEEFPLTPNGKIDRKSLPAPNKTLSEGAHEFTPPRNVLEEVLSGIWAKLFDVERVSTRENFFKLGGHSLLAVQLIARIHGAFKTELAVKTLFESPTIERLAEAMVQREARPGQTERMAQLIKRVKGMSANEVRKELRMRNSEKIWTEVASPT